MCGFFVRFKFRYEEALTPAQTLFDALKLIHHRGPDDLGLALFSKLKDKNELKSIGRRIFSQNELASVPRDNTILGVLGHVRLSILDLSPNSFQPMSSEDGRLTIVYNGEIYNYQELRMELQALGYVFKSNGDTEVFLKAFEEWGSECFKMFNGEWAAVIYDSQSHSLNISRDRFGIKPLFYYKTDDEIILSSEIKVIHALVDADPSINYDYLENYLLFGDAAWSTGTAFANIKKFPKAHFTNILLGKSSTKFDPKIYWKVSPNLSREPFQHYRAKQIAEQFFNLVDDAVRIRMRSDVQVGVSLSGGLDSSIIAYCAKQHHDPVASGGDLQSYSLVHPDVGHDTCDESDFINLIVEHLGLKANFKSPMPARLPELMDRICHHYEAPVNGLGVAGIFTIEAAHEAGIKVTLDGQGADEQLAGYSKFIPHFLNDLKTINFLQEATWLLIRSADRKSVAKQIFISLSWRVRKWLGVSSKAGGPLQLNLALNKTIEGGLMNLIHYADRRSMMHSIESRMPFLDHRLVEFNASVPSVYKIHSGFTKYYARLAFDGLLPDQVVWRRDKIGWNVPEREWLDNELRGWTNALFEMWTSPEFEKSRLTSLTKISLEHRLRVINLMHFLRLVK